MQTLQIDIVSDVMCPWCIIGYKGLESALNQLSDTVKAEINWMPFELNPQMPKTGQNVREHIMEKYGITAEQSAQNREVMAQRGREVGFNLNFSDDMRMINSFDLHRLLSWAKAHNKQHDLKMAFFKAHFTDNQPLNDNSVLLNVVEATGLDRSEAEAILNSDAYAEEVREEESLSMERGIHSVPMFIINGKYGINGGQPVDVFVGALQQIAGEISQAAK